MLVARLNEVCSGYCIPCEGAMTGVIITGAWTVLTNGLPTAILNCIVQAGCGHTGVLITSTKNLANGLPIGTIGNPVIGSFVGSVVCGSPNVMSL